MEKSVGGVDLDELMKARQELDQERGIETDPNMYSDYNNHHEENFVSLDNSSSEYEENNNYNQESNDLVQQENLDNSVVYADENLGAVFAEIASEQPEEPKAEVNSVGWVAEDADDDTLIGVTQTVSNYVENSEFSEEYQVEESMEESEEANQPSDPEPVVESEQPAEPDEPKDMNIYDIFSEFEVVENANKTSEAKAPEEPVAEAPVQTEPEPETVVKEEEPETSGFEDLINELLSGYDLDAEPEAVEENESQIETTSEPTIEPVVEQVVETVVEDVQEPSEAPVIVNRDPIQTVELQNEAMDILNDTVSEDVSEIVEPGPAIEETTETVEEPEEPVVQEEPAESEIEELQEELEKPEESEVEEDSQESLEEESEEDSLNLIEELKSSLESDIIEADNEEVEEEMEETQPEPVVAPASAEPQKEGLEKFAVENVVEKSSDDFSQTEVITDYSKLKDILQQELEEAERAEIEQIEEIKAQAVKSTKEYAEIESFKFVEEITNEEFKGSDKLSYLIGKNEQGDCVYGNFKEQYNLAIFGKEDIYTNSLVNSILLSLSLKNEVNDVNFIILDANINSSFDDYNKSSYIFFNRIAKTNKEILDTLIEASKELDERYNKLAGIGVKNIEQYNAQAQSAGLATMPYVIVVFNNYTKSSQATDNDKIIACLHRMLKYGRIAGIYSIVVATNPIEQDEINYNLPSRIAFRDTDDSVYTLGESGASSLDEDGDVLYLNIMDDKVVHLKTPIITETEKELLISGLEE